MKLLKAYTPALVAQIPSPALAAAALAAFNRVEQMIEAVTDENPEDGKQLEAIVRQFVSEDAVPIADGVIEERLALITNDRARNGLTLLSVPVVDTMRLLTDENPDNALQAEDVLDTFLRNPAVQDFAVEDLMVPILRKRITNPFLLALALEAIETGIREGADDLADVDVFVRDRTLEVIVAAKDQANAEYTSYTEVA